MDEDDDDGDDEDADDAQLIGVIGSLILSPRHKHLNLEWESQIPVNLR